MNKVQIERTINAPIDKVWKAWLDAKQLKAWHAPIGSSNKDTTSDAKVGGAYSITMVTPGGEDTVRGIYKTIDPMKKLVFTWEWDGNQMARGETTVTVEFKANGDKTDLKLTHEGFASDEAVTGHDKGWKGTLEHLEQYLNS